MVDIYKAPEAQLTKPTSVGEYGSIEIGTSGAYRFHYKETFSEAWKLVKGAKLSFFIAGILYWLVYVLVAMGIGLILTAVGLSVPDPISGAIPEGATAAAAGAGQVLSSIVIFSKYGYIVSLFFTTVLYYLLVAIGFVLLILPGIYLSIAYLMAFPLVTEKNLGPWRALETSRKAITKKWFKFFGFCILLLLIVVVSLIPLGIGLIWSAPFVMIAYGIVYRNMFGLKPET